MSDTTVIPLPAAGQEQAGKPSLLLSQAESWAYLGIPRATWFRLRSAGKLPDPVNVPTGGLYWRRSDLDAWVARLKAEKQPRRTPKARGTPRKPR